VVRACWRGLDGVRGSPDKTGPEGRIVMTVFWIIGISALAVIWAITIVDLFRHHHSGATTAGWLALGEAELRRSAAARPFDSTGM
jgi:hypothetical protein